MSEFGKPRGCNNGCNAMIYFDAHSTVGHPSSDKWVPLEFKEGLKTDMPHDCPNKKKQQNGTLTAVAATTTTNNTSLSFAESLNELLQDYIRLKRLELAS